jgi:hypothetical protein
MYKSFAVSAVLIGLTLLSFDSKLHRQFASIAPTPLDSQRSIVGPPAPPKILFYMSKSLAESAVLIGLTLLSFDSKLHRQFASTAPTPLDSQRSIVGPPAPPRILFYMYNSFAERAVLIALTLLSIE